MELRKNFVDISVPKYVLESLARYKHATPTRREYAPFIYNQPSYGDK